MIHDDRLKGVGLGFEKNGEIVSKMRDLKKEVGNKKGDKHVSDKKDTEEKQRFEKKKTILDAK